MDQRIHDALSLMLDALLLLDECQQYVAAAHLQAAIDALPDMPRGSRPDPARH